jgi:hypothetical protein
MHKIKIKKQRENLESLEYLKKDVLTIRYIRICE